MRFPRPRSRRAALLSPLAALTTLALSAGVIGVATPAFAGDAPGAATQIVLTVPGDFVAGIPQTVTVNAEDADGNVDPTYNDTTSVFSDDPTASYPGGSTVVLVAGTGTVVVELDTAGSETLTPVPPPPPFNPDDPQPGLAGVSLPVTVDAGPTASLSITAPSQVAAGSTFYYTANELDAYGNVVPSGDLIRIQLLNPVDEVDDFYAAQSNSYAGVFPAQADPSYIHVSDADNDDVAPVDASVVVGPAVVATHYQINADQPVAPAGYQTHVTVRAADDDGDLADVNAAVTITSTDPQAVINGGNPVVNLVDGVASFTVVEKTAGPETLSADSVGLTGSLQLEAFSGSAVSTSVDAVHTVAVGDQADVTAVALDQYGNVDTNDYDTDVPIEWSSNADAANPATVDFFGGYASFSGSFDTTGPGSVTVDGPGGPTQAFIVVRAAIVATRLVITSDPSTAVAGQPGTLTVTAEDADGNVATSLSDDVTVADADTGATIAGDSDTTTVTLVNGTADLAAAFDVAGDQDITATSTGALTGSVVVPVVAGALQAISFGPVDDSVVAGADTTFTVYATDAFGNLVTDMPGVHQLTWSINSEPNNPATATFVDGVATITGRFGTAGTGTLHVAGSTVGDPTADASITVTAAAVIGSGTNPVTNPVVSDRLSGPDRFATATAISTSEFPAAGSAGAVVLARSDDAADSTVGIVLAAAKNAPLLFTTGATLPTATAAEITRVLPAGGTVYLLGGTAAVPASVATQLAALGFKVVRLAGSDRYGTAVAVADAIGGNGPVFLATGNDFADALTAGPAAAHGGGVVLLTNGGTMPASVTAYLAAHHGTVFAVGGQASAADSSATAVIGADRYATAAEVASKFFTAPANVGVASGTTFADALSGGAYLAHLGGPLLLTAPPSLSAPADAYLGTNAGSTKAAFIFGGTAAVSSSAQTQIDASLGK